MTVRNYLKGGLILSGGSVLSAACSFARNIIIARLISVEDFGIAATFAMTMSLVEMASNLALDRLLVQASDGDAPRMLATAHAFQVFRGVLGTVVLFLLSGPIAELFQVPEVAWAFRIVAVVPLLRSLMHLDASCQQRDMRFTASVWLDTTPQVLMTLAAAPLALWLGDYRVMLFMVIGQVAIMTLVSHLVAERPYRWAWDRAIIERMLEFGWPLLINGFLMFAIFQGDKAIVAASFSMEQLGWFSAAFGLTLLPSLVGARILRSFLLPLLAKVQDSKDVFQQRAEFATQACMITGAAMGTGFIVAGPSLLVALYDERYAAGATVITWLGMMQAARLAKTGPAIVAMAKGETTNPLFANLVRCSGIGAALVAIPLGFGISAVVVCGLLGELLASLAAILLLRARLHLDVKAIMSCFGGFLIVISGCSALAVLGLTDEVAIVRIYWGVPVSLSTATLLSALFPSVLRSLRSVVSGRTSPLTGDPKSASQ